jgi:hypothetical protein
LRLNAEWEWQDKQRQAINVIKKAIISPLALSSIDYNKPALLAFVSVNASAEGAGAVLEQIGRDRKRYLIRFKSTL